MAGVDVLVISSARTSVVVEHPLSVGSEQVDSGGPVTALVSSPSPTSGSWTVTVYVMVAISSTASGPDQVSVGSV